MRMVIGLVVWCAVASACSPAADAPTAAPASPSRASETTSAEAGVLFSDDFETNPFPRWDPVTKSAWVWQKTDRTRVFTLAKNVPLKQSVRAPFNRNLIKGLSVGSFQLDVDLKSTTDDYPNRDLSLMFGYQDPAHMYYCHLGRTESDTSNNIFIVDGEDRRPISTHTTPGTPWDAGWHHARVIRNVDDGSISVYFDDMTTPAMTAVDKTFVKGHVGIGSFDDTGQFDNVIVRDIASSDEEQQ